MKMLTPEQTRIMQYWGNNLTVFDVYEELKDEPSEYQDKMLSAAILHYGLEMNTEYRTLLIELRYHLLGY